MNEFFLWLTVITTAIIAGTIGGVVGFGSGVLLLPVCAYVFGAREAVPLLTVASLLGNLSRAYFSWKEIDWRVVMYFVIGAVPFSALGAYVFVQIDAVLLECLLGVFLISLVIFRRLLGQGVFRVQLIHFPFIGAVMGFLSGVVATTGPINAPFFLYFGLVKGAYLSTEALSTMSMHIVKSLVYGKYAVLNITILVKGIAVGTAMSVGSYLGKRVINKMTDKTFFLVVEVLLVVAGVLMIIQGLR